MSGALHNGQRVLGNLISFEKNVLNLVSILNHEEYSKNSSSKIKTIKKAILRTHLTDIYMTIDTGDVGLPMNTLNLKPAPGVSIEFVILLQIF
jgi:hypothetical protein